MTLDTLIEQAQQAKQRHCGDGSGEVIASFRVNGSDDQRDVDDTETYYSRTELGIWYFNIILGDR